MKSLIPSHIFSIAVVEYSIQEVNKAQLLLWILWVGPISPIQSLTLMHRKHTYHYCMEQLLSL